MGKDYSATYDQMMEGQGKDEPSRPSNAKKGEPECNYTEIYEKMAGSGGDNDSGNQTPSWAKKKKQKPKKQTNEAFIIIDWDNRKVKRLFTGPEAEDKARQFWVESNQRFDVIQIPIKS